VKRLAILAWLLCPAFAPALAADEDREKLSNDRPDRPLQMPPASSEAKEAFDDFDRFSRRGAWERATKAIQAIPDAQAARFVDGQDGFMITVARKRRSVLAGLSPEGQAAYRLFHDDEAKKLLDGAEGPGEQAALEQVYSRYFLTSVGDDAADRLGDLYFERGDFDRAADCWLALLRERPDTDLAPALIAVKAAFALARAGRRPELEILGREVADRHAGEVVSLGGRKAPASEHLRKALGEPGPAASASASAAPTRPGPELVDPVAPAWQVRFGGSVMAGMSPAETTQWEANSFSLAVPRTAIEGATLFANYLGHVFAVDLGTGKMLWRSASFHNLDLAAMQNQVRGVDPTRYAIVAGLGHVWTLSRDLRDPNFQAPFLLTCRRAEGGDVVWKSSDFPEFAEVDLVGQPILARDTLYIAAKTGSTRQQNQPDQFVLAIRPHDGKLLWKTQVGTFRQGQQQMYSYYGMADTSPQPRLACRSGSIYVDTHSGVLARLDAESGRIDWGYGYETEATSNGGRFFFYRMGNQEPTSAATPPTEAGEALLVKGAKAGQVCAIDPDRMKLLWTRQIAKSARIIGADDSSLYLGGPELGAIDLKTRSLRWSTRLPGGSEEARPIVRADGIWQLTPRGVFELDPPSGRVRRVFRGQDPGASGGDLLLTDRWALAISNRTISAYPRGAAGTDRAAGGAAASQSRGSE